MMSGVESFKHECDQEDKEEERLRKRVSYNSTTKLVGKSFLEAIHMRVYKHTYTHTFE